MRARRRRRDDAQVEKGRAVITTKLVRSRNVLSGDQKVEEFESEVFETDPAYVRVAHGVTRSIGDFESLRVDVSVSMPCYKEKIDETVRLLGERVEEYLEDELNAYFN